MANDILAINTAVSVRANVWIGERQLQETLSLEITEQYGEHSQLLLRCYQDQVQQQGTLFLNEAQSLLGQVVEVTLKDYTGKNNNLESLFVVSKVSLEHNALNEGILLIEGQAPTSLLDAGPHYECFYRQPLTAIAKTVCKPLEQVKATLQARPTLTASQGFVCRFGESSWDFLKRISNEIRQWLYFNGKTLIFGEPEAVQARDLVYGQTCIRLSLSSQTQPVTAGYMDYDSIRNISLLQQGNSDTQIAHTDRGLAFKKSKDIYGSSSYRYPEALSAGEENLKAIGSGSGGSTSADMYNVEGRSTLQELRLGIITNLILARAGEVIHHTPIRILSVKHVWEVTGYYYNEFTGINAQSPQPPQMPCPVPQTAPVVGEVIANNDPLGQGRVQVKFIGWQQDHSLPQTDWIRVLTPDAGSSGAVNKNRGYVFIPEVGDQVMIAFENNNPERPYVQGSLFHGGNGAGGFADNHLKTIMTRSGCLIQIDDTEGQGSIYLKDPSGNTWHMDGVGNINVNAPKNMTFNAGENIDINAGINIKVSAGKNMDVTVTDNLSESIGKNYTHLSENQTIVANKNKTENIGDEYRQTSGNANVQTVKGDMLLRGTGLAVFQGGKDVKVSKG